MSNYLKNGCTLNLIMNPQVQKLLNLPQYEQRSPEWFEQRKNKLTSSDVDTVLGNNKYAKPLEVLFKKCGISKPFTGNEATRHGQKYEDEAIKHYCELYNKKTHSFGLLPHPEIEWLGGSPDDITEDGIVIEVKCPLRRKIVMGEIPKHYIGQIKMNMEICNLDKAVFIEYRPKHMNENNEILLNVVELDRDPEWFKSVFPILESFWNEVLHYRTVGIENHKDYLYYNNLSTPKNVIEIPMFQNDIPLCHFVDPENDENPQEP
jgi:putative phage-type endonuclease